MHTDKFKTFKRGYENFMLIIATENIDIMSVQEAYLYQEEIRGVSKSTERTHMGREEEGRQLS
jgi:hypothetical protein